MTTANRFSRTGLALSFLRWASAIPVYPFVAVAAWLSVPGAVKRAEPWPDLHHPEITPATRTRFAAEPRASERAMVRLAPRDRWLELFDDQILPVGLYESEIAEVYRAKGWYASSIVFLRRNLAHGLCIKLGETLAGSERRWSYGERGTTERAGHWFGVVEAGNRLLWQWIGAWHVGSVSVEVNTGYVIRDLFDGAWYEGRPARWRLMSLRIRKRSKPNVPD